MDENFNDYEVILNLLNKEIDETVRIINTLREHIETAKIKYPSDLVEHYKHYAFLCNRLSKLYHAKNFIDQH